MSRKSARFMRRHMLVALIENLHDAIEGGDYKPLVHAAMDLEMYLEQLTGLSCLVQPKKLPEPAVDVQFQFDDMFAPTRAPRGLDREALNEITAPVVA